MSGLPAISRSQIGDQNIATPLQIVALLTLLSFAPAILVTLTAFVRIVIVLSFLRQAVGTQSMPPNQVVRVARALPHVLRDAADAPRDQRARRRSPYQEEEIGDRDALVRAYDPLRAVHAAADAGEGPGALPRRDRRPAAGHARADVPPQALLPAFLISELKTAFQMGFLIYIPFLILDMVVASVLTSMGMITLPPVLISLPFKLMLFVLVDGWNVLIGSLVQSFR